MGGATSVIARHPKPFTIAELTKTGSACVKQVITLAEETSEADVTCSLRDLQLRAPEADGKRTLERERRVRPNGPNAWIILVVKMSIATIAV